ncbi:RICIN domain-containing protein [Streptomyces sp. NBC_00572]
MKYVNVHSGKCLEVADWRTDNGDPVRQWDCTGQPNQQW